MIYIYTGLPMLLEILLLVVYSRVISYSEIRGRIKPQYFCMIITQSPKEKEYGDNVAPGLYESLI